MKLFTSRIINCELNGSSTTKWGMVGSLVLLLASLFYFAQPLQAAENASDSSPKAKSENPTAAMDTNAAEKSVSKKTDTPSRKDRMLSGHRGIVGREVRNREGEAIGEIENVLVDPDENKIQAVVSVGGFWGIGDEEIVLPLEKLQLNQKRSYVFFNGTEQELKAFPEYREPARRSARYGYPYRERDNWGPPAAYYTYDPYYDGDRRGMGRMHPRDRWNRDDDMIPQYGMRGYYHDGRMGSRAYRYDDRRTYGDRNGTAWRENDYDRQYQSGNRRSGNQTDRWYGNRRTDVTYDQRRLRASDLIGKSVRNARDETIGEVEDIIVASNGRMDLLISVNEFLGMGGKQVRADLDDVELDNPDYVFYDISSRELENQPEYSADGQ